MCPLKGLTIMNWVLMILIDSRISFRPQHGLTITNQFIKWEDEEPTSIQEFPSPTGVNYYESYQQFLNELEELKKSFRPQQGLTIMNLSIFHNGENKQRFRPQQGLTIMNSIKYTL